MAIARRLPIGHDAVFPHGAYLVSEVGPVIDFDKSTRESRIQQIDADSGLPIWSVDVVDADPDATKKNRTVTVKIIAKVQPVPPSNDGSSPFTPVVFDPCAWTTRSRSGWSSATEPARPAPRPTRSAS